MNNRKTKVMRILLHITLSLFPSIVFPQANPVLSLEQCYSRARENYPLLKQHSLIEKSNIYSLENISKGSLPQIYINGQATYQSGVTQIPVHLPGLDMPVLNKDQYRLYGEANQALTDLITVKAQKKLQEANNQIQQQSLEAELYKIKERINQLFFGVILLEEQLRQNGLTKKDISLGIDKVTASIKNGTEFRSSLDKLKAEMLKATQKDIELKSARRAFLDMLAAFINQSLDDSVRLEKPAEPLTSGQLNRPELKSFTARKQVYDYQSNLLNIHALPKFSLFVQGGIGQPSPVNMLNPDMSGYYIAGLKLNWSISNFYTLRKEKKLNEINQALVGVEQETFVFNTRQSLLQQNSEISRLRELINTDIEIVKLRTSIKTTANSQLDNGVITVNDYVKEINAEDQARQAASLHQIQLLMAQYNYNTTAGN
ncbi:TolC family protein [Pararcticibacter amylolyticus]|nr:TolC family protein [Pararcticibacter amylolyticus]